MKRYTFTTPQFAEVLPSGKVFIYFDEQASTETVSRKDEETGEEVSETYDIWIYRRAESALPLSKGKIANAIIREDYTQDAVEAIFRHTLAGDAGHEEEFAAFNACAEAAKARAVEILNRI